MLNIEIIPNFLIRLDLSLLQLSKILLQGMDEKIMHEVRYTIEDAKKRTSDGREVLKRVDKYFDLPDLNIIWGLVAATR